MHPFPERHRLLRAGAAYPLLPDGRLERHLLPGPDHQAIALYFVRFGGDYRAPVPGIFAQGNPCFYGEFLVGVLLIGSATDHPGGKPVQAQTFPDDAGRFFKIPLDRVGDPGGRFNTRPVCDVLKIPLHESLLTHRQERRQEAPTKQHSFQALFSLNFHRNRIDVKNPPSRSASPQCGARRSMSVGLQSRRRHSLKWLPCAKRQVLPVHP
jgi:hypothetical protein